MRGASCPATAPDLLPSRPVVPALRRPPSTSTKYARNVPADAPVTAPTPLTPEPEGRRSSRKPASRSAASAASTCGRSTSSTASTCVDRHRRSDARRLPTSFRRRRRKRSSPWRFPAAINLIWEPSDAKDVAGYLVLRSEARRCHTDAADDQAGHDACRIATTSVRAGVRYIYAVVAVDKAGNRSHESNRVEETAQ